MPRHRTSDPQPGLLAWFTGRCGICDGAIVKNQSQPPIFAVADLEPRRPTHGSPCGTRRGASHRAWRRCWARFRAANGRVVWVTETYRRKDRALNAMWLIRDTSVRHFTSAYSLPQADIEVREVDER